VVAIGSPLHSSAAIGALDVPLGAIAFLITRGDDPVANQLRSLVGFYLGSLYYRVIVIRVKV